MSILICPCPYLSFYRCLSLLFNLSVIRVCLLFSVYLSIRFFLLFSIHICLYVSFYWWVTNMNEPHMWISHTYLPVRVFLLVSAYTYLYIRIFLCEFFYWYLSDVMCHCKLSSIWKMCHEHFDLWECPPTWTCVNIYMYICIYVYIHICIFIYIWICIYVCVYIDIYIYICIYRNVP